MIRPSAPAAHPAHLVRVPETRGQCSGRVASLRCYDVSIFRRTYARTITLDPKNKASWMPWDRGLTESRKCQTFQWERCRGSLTNPAYSRSQVLAQGVHRTEKFHFAAAVLLNGNCSKTYTAWEADLPVGIPKTIHVVFMVYTEGPKGFPYSYFGAQVYTIQLHGPFGIQGLIEGLLLAQGSGYTEPEMGPLQTTECTRFTEGLYMSYNLNS